MVDAFGLLSNPSCSLVLALKSSDCQIGPYQFKGEFDTKDLLHTPQIYLIEALLNDQSHADLYRMADFLVYPSQGEAPGLQVGEAQLCGTIPIVTGYTELQNESCFPELTITDFTLTRGQFNCYRAMVPAGSLAEKMQNAFSFWVGLQEDRPEHLVRYGQFVQDVQAKFQERTWQNSALQLDSVFQSLLSGGLRVEQQVDVI